MAWRFDWLRSWDEVWEPRHLARWRAASDDPTAHATPFMHPDLVRGWLATMGGPVCVIVNACPPIVSVAVRIEVPGFADTA